MAYPPVFLDVLATRIAEYTGRERAGVLAVVRHAGDRLPDRIADLMLEKLRAHLGEETAAERAAAELRSEQDRANNELILGLDQDVATETLALATQHSGLPPRPPVGEMTDVAAEAPVHAEWAEFELALERLVGRVDAETGARVRDLVTGTGSAPAADRP